MAVAFDVQGHIDTGVTNTTATSLSGTPITVGSGSNRAVAVCLTFLDSVADPTGITVTWGGTSMAAVTNANGSNATAGINVHWFALVNPTSGAQTIAANWTNGCACIMGAISFTGVDQTGGTTSFAHGTGGSGTSALATITVTSATGNMTVGAYGSTASNISATSATQDFVDTTPSTAGLSGAMNHTAGAASNTMTATCGNDFWAAAGFDVVASTGGAVTDLRNFWYRLWETRPVDPKAKFTPDQQFLAYAFSPATFPGPGATVAGADIAGPTFTKTVIYQVKAQTLLAKEDIPKQEWTTIWDEPVWPKRGLAAHEQQSLAWSGFTPASTATPFGWNDPIEQPVRNWQRSSVYSAPYLAWSPTPDAFGWNDPIEQPVRNWQRSTIYTAPFLALGVPPAQVFFPYDRWQDTAPAAKRVAQNPYWSYGTFVTPTFIPTYTQWTQWPDFATKAKPPVNFQPWTFLEPPPQVWYPPNVTPDFAPTAKRTVEFPFLAFLSPVPSATVIADWPDFVRRKPPPLDTQPLAWSPFTTPAQVVAYVATQWPDFALRKKAAVDFTPWTFLEPAPQVFFPYAPWDDFTRRKQPPLDTQPLAWSTFTPAQVVTYSTSVWPDFVPGRKRAVDFTPWTFIPTPAQVFFPYDRWADTAPGAKRTVEYPYLAFVAPQPPWNAWTIWPDQVPTRKKPVVDFQSWVFIEPPQQVFFPYAPWDDFTRRKPQFPDTQPIAGPISFTVEVTLVSKWFEALSSPPGPKRGLGTHLQSSYTNDTMAAAIALFARARWYAPLSEPVRRKGIRPELQKFTERDLFVAFVPVVYLATLNATEQGDFLTAVLYQFNTPLLAYVDIVQNDPRQRGNLGIIENVAQSSIVASIVEPQTVPATGQPVSVVAGARVAIIVQGAGP